MFWTEVTQKTTRRTLAGIAIGAAIGVLILLLASTAIGQAPAVATTQFYRDTVYPTDPDRDWTCVWTRGDAARDTSFGFFNSGDDIWDAVTLVDQRNNAWPVKPVIHREADWYEQTFYRTFRVPATTPLGQYAVRLNKQNVGTLTVAKLAKNSRTLSGRNNGPYVLTPNTRHVGYGAFIFGDVVVAPGATLEGVTVVDGITQGVFTNGILKDCTFRRGQVGGMIDWTKPQEYSDHGALYQDCHFDRCTVTGCCSGCFLNCRFTDRVTGHETNGHNFVNERGKRLCMFNCVFDRTDRGPVLRTNWGDNSDGLYVGLHFLNINSTTNGNELVCGEGTDGSATRWDRNMFIGLRAFNCNGVVQPWNVLADGNLIATSIFGPGSGVRFSGIRPQRWNQVRFCELAKAVALNSNGTGATNTKLHDNNIAIAP